MEKQCDFCKEYVKTQAIHCNACIKNHQICLTCLVDYKDDMKIKPVTKQSLYESNLKKWV